MIHAINTIAGMKPPTKRAPTDIPVIPPRPQAPTDRTYKDLRQCDQSRSAPACIQKVSGENEKGYCQQRERIDASDHSGLHYLVRIILKTNKEKGAHDAQGKDDRHAERDEKPRAHQ